MNKPKGNFSKKQQARAIEHVSVKPNERRKKLSLLQIQRGEVIKYSTVKISWRQSRQIWQGSQKCRKLETNLFAFELFAILFFGFSH